MPRELIATAPGQVAFREYESPPLGAEQIRVRSQFGAAKHGTEMALFKGYANARGAWDKEYRLHRSGQTFVNYPVNLGNTCVGEVVEVGSGVSEFRVGDQVFRYGSFREEHVWPAAGTQVLPAGVPWQAAACLDPADFALGAVRDGHLRIGDAVAIFSMGAIGLMVLQLAKLAGAYPIIAVEPIGRRRQLALQLGADVALDPTQCDVGLEIKEATGKRGADVCIRFYRK